MNYTFSTHWSEGDRAYVGTCAEFPSLSWIDPDRARAHDGIEKLVAEAVAEMRASGETPPAPRANGTTTPAAESLVVDMRPPAQLGQRAIARVEVTLGENENAFELEVNEPAIVRAASFWMHEPKVLASAMRGVQKIPMPLLLVEIDPAAPKVKKRFVWSPTGGVVGAKDGYQVAYRATAMMPVAPERGGPPVGNITAHLFEIVERPS